MRAPAARGAPAREVEVAVVERAEPLLVGLSLGVDFGDVRVDMFELVGVFCLFLFCFVDCEPEKKEMDKR